MRTSLVVRALLRCRPADTASTSPCSSLLLHETSISTPNRISSPRMLELPPPISSLPSRSFSTTLSPSLKLHFSNPCLHSSHRTFTSSSASDAPGITEITSKDEFESTLQNIQEKLSSAVFYFTAAWCGPCRAVAPIIQELSKQYPRTPIYKVDIDKEDLQITLSRLHVSAVPTFHLYQNGKKTASVVGADVTQLKGTMESLYREAQSFLAGSGVVGEHLDEEIKRGDLKVEQTGHDINMLMNQAARLRTIKRQAHERYPAPDALILVQAVGDCLVHLETTIALMEAKNELTEANVSIARQCQAALDKYGNNFPAIPKDM